MNDIKLLIIIGVVIGFVIALYFAVKKQNKEKISQFDKREDMNYDDFCSSYYGNTDFPKEIIVDVLNLISNATGVSATKIRPYDTFKKDFSAKKGWEFDDGLTEIYWYADSIRKNIGDTDKVELNTVDDLIRYIVKLKRIK